MSATSTPPFIAHRRKSSRDFSPVLAFVTLLLLSGIARFSANWHLPLPVCGLKKLTGVPCPLCGSTRCFQALAAFDFPAALRWNPLTFLAGLCVVSWFLLWMAEHFSGRRFLSPLHQRLRAPAFKFVIVGAVLLNWIYLCLVLP